MMKRSVPKPTNLGCCCKRSACRKKYCECFRRNAACTKACKCIGCCNKQEPFMQSRSGSLDFPTQIDFQRPIFGVKFRDNSAVGGSKSNNNNSNKKKVKSKLPKSQKETEAAITQIAPTNNESASNFTVKEQPVFVNFITKDVVETSVQCMIAQAEECSKNRLNNVQTERMILEEFDRCLVRILTSMGINETANK